MTFTTVPWATPSSASMMIWVPGSLATALTKSCFRSSSLTGCPETRTSPDFRMETTSDLAPGSSSLVAPFGRLTFTPSREAVSTMTLDETMKMIRSTRKMSVSGVMLMSAKMPASPPVSSSGSLPSAIPGLRLALGVAQRLEELVDEQLELDGDAREALVEVVVDDDRLDGDGDAGRGGDERLRDALRHDAEAAAAVL